MFSAGQAAQQAQAESRPEPAAESKEDSYQVEEDYSLLPDVIARRNGKKRLRPTSPVVRGHSNDDGHDHSHDEEDGESEAQAPCPNGDCRQSRRQSERITTRRQVRTNIRASRSIMSAPIWAPFAQSFAACAPAGCQPAKIGVDRQVVRDQRTGREIKSCHYSRRAIDVGAMICPSGTYQAGSRTFNRMVACMKNKIPTLYQQAYKLRKWGVTLSSASPRQVTLAHYDHAHFSIGCYNGTFK